MHVFEIFQSIQGETTRAGLPMHFVRLAGCDLQCAYCDTPDARDADAGRPMTVPEVLAAVPPPPAWVAITGGEPALQLADVNALIAALLDRRQRVLVETSGAHPIDDLNPRAVRIVDVKTPGSGMADRNCWENLDRLTPQDEVKFVLTGRADYDWSRAVVARCRLADRVPILFSPARPGLDARRLAEWIVADGLPVRLNLQMHKDLGLR